ncbi:MAG: rRNA adenine N-6-methyltransferase family protein, partial [Clostridia bacterium]
MDLCNIDNIRGILKRHGFRFSKSLGQNFLTAAWVPEEIAESSEVDSGCCVLEIGPGMGALTRALAGRAHHVVAVELDRELIPVLDETLAGLNNITVINEDIMKCD